MSGEEIKGTDVEPGATDGGAAAVDGPAAPQAPAEEPESADPLSDEAGSDEDEPPADPGAQAASKRKLKWYVVHTYSGFENRAQKGLMERIKLEGLDEHFGEVLVPVENVVELVRGSKRSSKRKFFPGYMFVQMELNERTWHVVKNTPKITGFVGNARNPVAVREAEVQRLTQQIDEGTLTAKPKIAFEEGEHVRVIDGPFSSFNGVVEDVKPEKQKLRVLVSIFGRATPVELDFMQVEKTTG